MKRWTLLLAGAALWLFLAAIPALADGGPHVAANNSGQSTLTADSCAGCHRAHTAQARLLLVTDEEDICLACHGIGGTGATTNVEDGVQYASAATSSTVAGPVIGALRSGGFVNARINSSDPYRAAVTGSGTFNVPTKVSVLDAGQAVTSSHMHVDGGYTGKNVAWGNGAISAATNPGPSVSVGCATCHNVHGNGQYRILNQIPSPDAATGSTFTTVAAPGVTVSDYLVGGAVPSTTRNYTVIQTDAAGTRIYLADNVIAGQTAGTWTNTAGDYLHMRVPWNGPSGSNDAPNGLSDSNTGFPAQIASWCSSCHTRYMHSGGSGEEDSGDAIFAYRHATTGRRTCTTCHVSHGSNAAMGGEFSKDFPYPGSTTAVPNSSASSRLLKVDNRGTCQVCHNPTGVAVPARGTTPNPLLP